MSGQRLECEAGSGTVRRDSGVFGGPRNGGLPGAETELAVDADLAAQEVDPVDGQAQQLAGPQT